MSSEAEPSEARRPGWTRRRVLGGAAALLPGWLVLGCERDRGLGVDRGAVLRAMAGHLLPSGALGAEGVSETVGRFERWSEGFRPRANLDHPYLSSDELRYGPEDPRPHWEEQLDTLELEARARHGAGFAALSGAQQLELLLKHLPGDAGTELPWAPTASHVAVALLAWFYGTPQANDLCHQRRIDRHGCRGLPGVSALPEPLEVSPRGEGGVP